MPPEPLPWDRRDFRKHERSGSDPRLGGGGFGGGGPQRWREQQHHPHAPPPYQQQPPQQQRWYSDFRSPRLLPPASFSEGHDKQGGWHMYSDDAGQGFLPLGSCYADRNSRDENCRPFGSRGNGRYLRNNRENRGSFTRKDWKAPSVEPTKSPSAPAKSITEVSNLRCTENTQQCCSRSSSASHLHPDSINLSDQSQPQPQPLVKEKNNKNGGVVDENRGSFTRKDWKAPSLEPTKSLSTPAKSITEVNNLRSIENTQQSCSRSSSASHLHPDSINLSDQSQPLAKEKNNKNGGIVDETTEMVGAALESEKENCMESVDWKPLKRTRLGSFSTRCSSLGHSSSSKSLEVGSTETVAEVQPNNATLTQSPADDAGVRSISPVQSDETGSRKKPRLGWGEGLAKFEKKKVDGPEDGAHKNELVLDVITTETLQSQSVNLPEKNPVVASLSDCVSPGTSSSVACSSSPGVEEKEFFKEANTVRDTTNLSYSPSIESQTHTHHDAPTFNLENLEIASIANLSSLIEELLQSNNSTSAERSCVPTTSLNKLLVWKVDMLKALEMTESEIESLETELKSLLAAPRICCPAGSTSVRGEEQLKPCEGLDTASKCGIKLDPLQVDSYGGAPVGPENLHILSKDEDIDSPGSATSKFVDLLPTIFPSETKELTEGSTDLDVNNSGNLDEKCLKNGLDFEENSGFVDNHVLTVTTTREDLARVSNVHPDINNVYDLIVSSNRDAADSSMEQLNKLLPKQCLSDSYIESTFSSLQNHSIVKEKFLTRMRFLRFKEKVLTIKFKVFQHFWREGRLVSIKKLRQKTRKKFDPSGHKRNHSSLRSRGPSYARGPQTVPADEVIEFVNGLLSESAFKPYRNTLKMPALVLDKEVKISRFISNNGLVEDPCAVEKERPIINSWTSEEKEIFVDKFAAFGKDFKKIASFLDHKTVADCVEFYYKNHKSECFEKTRKDPGFLKQIKSQSTTYLVASGKRRNPELNAASLDILGAVSAIAANVDNAMDIQRNCPSNSCKAVWGDDGVLQASDTVNNYGSERETEAVDVLASMCGSLSSEAVSSCITGSVDKPGDVYQDQGGLRISSSTKHSLTPEVTQDVDDECSDESCCELNPTDWSDEEKFIFIQAVSMYGRNFSMISECVRTRSIDQCKSFFSKARHCLGLDSIQPAAGTASGDDDGGGSDIEDGCAETLSDTCNNGSGCKMEVDLPPPDMNLNHRSEHVTPERVSENSLVIGSDGDDKPVTDNNVHSEEQIATNQDLQSVVVSSNTEPEREVADEDDLGMPNGLNEAENSKALVEVSDGNHGEENHEQRPLLAKGNPGCKIVEARDANSSDKSLTKSEPPPSTGDCQQHLLGRSSSDSVQSSQILWGYPVSVQNMKEINGNVNCKKPTALPDIPEQDVNMNSDPHTDSFLKKCNGLRQQSGVAEAPFPSLKPSSDESRRQSGCSSAGDKPSGKGDVKLFGTILIPSPEITNNSVEQTSGNSNKQEYKTGRESLNLRLGAEQKANFDLMQSKLDSNNYVGNENIPVGSFGFWNGNRVRTSIPPLPDSALLMAKYPAVFSHYASPSLNLEQPPLHGTSIFPSRELSINNGLADYQRLRNQGLHSFAIDMKQTQDVAFTEMHRRNGLNVALGMQQVAGGWLSGLNVVGSQGAFVGGQRSSLSDPVAAMTMHYARLEQLNMQGRSIIKEDDRWIRK